MKIRHVALEKRKRVERENHAEAEGRVGRVLLEDINLPRRKAALDEQREQKPGRPGPDYINTHES